MEKAVFGKEGMELTLRGRIAELEAALRQWKCPECAHYGNPCLPDQYCHGTGLHPVAALALKETK